MQAGVGVVFEKFFQIKHVSFGNKNGPRPCRECENKLYKSVARLEKALESAARQRQAGKFRSDSARSPQRSRQGCVRAGVSRHHSDGLHSNSCKFANFFVRL